MITKSIFQNLIHTASQALRPKEGKASRLGGYTAKRTRPHIAVKTSAKRRVPGLMKHFVLTYRCEIQIKSPQLETNIRDAHTKTR